MWAIRRASTQFRSKGLPSGRIFCGKTDVGRCCSETSNSAIIAPQETKFDGLLSLKRFYSKSYGFSREFRTFSSQVGAKSSGDELDDGFSELETPQDRVEEATSGDDPSSEPELSENEDNAEDAEIVGKKKFTSRASSEMCKAILSAPALPACKVLDKWVEEGNKVTQAEIDSTMEFLRKRRLNVKALQFSEWLESSKHVEFDESYYVTRVDLIAKAHGLFKAEQYVNQLPEPLRTEKVFGTLLTNIVSSSNVKKAEELFKKMKEKFPLTSFLCNQMLLLYKKTDRKKIADVLLVMEKEDIKPSVFTYMLLVDAKGQSNDITGMEKIIETMKAEGMKPTSQILTSMARYYNNAGLQSKAEAVLKEMEGDDLTKNRWACRLLIPIYASLGRADEVERIWNVCESKPHVQELLATIEAWGQLKKVEKAEAVFDTLLKKVKKSSPYHYNVLLKVYAHNKMLNKGKELVNQMAAAGCKLGPWTWDALVQLYIGAGEVEKADSILGKAIKKRMGKPLLASYMAIMDKYAERGDVDNAEKIFQMLKDAGYFLSPRQYQSLLNAYVHAKKPAYGFWDRMKADNIPRTRHITNQLASIDAFRKSPMSDLLE